MSQETSTWLNTNTLIGMTEKRGNAWHYRAERQGAESNHYPGAIPVADVERRLFHWDALSRPAYVSLPADFEDATGIDGDGLPHKLVVVEDKQHIVRSDNHHVMGTFKSGYQPHQYREWLLTNVGSILDDDLGISSAGLLKGGAVAWVEVSVPDTITTPEGYDFRPNLLAATSFDGSVATTYSRTVTATVCDNTMAAALMERGQKIKIRHSRYSKLKIGEAREALAMVYTLADDFAEQIAALTQTKVTGKQWGQFLDAYVPPPTEGMSGRSQTMAENKRDTLKRLYTHDNRVSPWAGTALGVIQAVNTFVHHEGIVRGASRTERNMLNTVEGKFDSLDQEVFDTLTKVLAS